MDGRAWIGIWIDLGMKDQGYVELVYMEIKVWAWQAC